MCFRIQMFRKLWSTLQDVILRLILSKNAVSTYARLSAVTSLHTLMYLRVHGNKPTPVAAGSKEWVCWKCWFESRWGHGYLSLVSILSVCCQVQVSVAGRSLVQGRPTECGVSECYLETSTMRSPRPIRLSNRKKSVWNWKCYSTCFIILQNTKESCVTDTNTKDIFSHLLSFC
jgi:hypothetical protein